MCHRISSVWASFSFRRLMKAPTRGETLLRALPGSPAIFANIQIVQAWTRTTQSASVRQLDYGNMPGAPWHAIHRSIEVRRKAAKKRLIRLRPHIESARASGCSSLREIARYLNSREVRTTRGNLWSASEVRRVIIRLSSGDDAHAQKSIAHSTKRNRSRD